MIPLIVVALGGNALLQKGETSYSSQLQHARHSMKRLVPLLKKYRLVITHGNGPQVGNILLRDEAAKGRAPHLPLDVDVAQTQGEIGYILQQSLDMLTPDAVRILSLLSRTLVHRTDKGFSHPTKPIGPFYPSPTHFKKKRIPFVYQKGKGYRRVVASPAPLEILEAPSILELVKKDFVVITCGGGGIPVIKKGKKIVGVEAVVDKDLASACLGSQIRAQELIILTDVPCVYSGFGTKKQRRIASLTVSQAQQLLGSGEFPAGSMGPKIQAAVQFLLNKGKRVIITSPTQLQKALLGQSGTIITRR